MGATRGRWLFLREVTTRCSEVPSSSQWHGHCDANVRQGDPSATHLIVMRRQLMQELLDAQLLSGTVHVGHLVFGKAAVVLVNLGGKRGHSLGDWHAHGSRLPRGPASETASRSQGANTKTKQACPVKPADEVSTWKQNDSHQREHGGLEKAGRPKVASYHFLCQSP